MSIKVLKKSLPLNSLKTVTCIQKDLNTRNAVYCQRMQAKKLNSVLFCPRNGDPALVSPICRSGQRNYIEVHFCVVLQCVLQPIVVYVNVNLSFKMSLNLKIFGVLKNIFYSGRPECLFDTAATTSQQLSRPL